MLNFGLTLHSFDALLFVHKLLEYKVNGSVAKCASEVVRINYFGLFLLICVCLDKLLRFESCLSN